MRQTWGIRTAMRSLFSTTKILGLAFAVFAVCAPSQAGTRTAVDQLGRRMTIPDHPRRIVSLAPNITEIIFALGQESRLVGATTYSNYPPAAANLPRVGSYVRLDLERIVALSPDLCIAIKDGNPKATADRLTALNIPVYAVDPRNMETVVQTVLEIGRLLNADENARRLVADMQSRLAAIQSEVTKIQHHPRVFFQIGVAPIVSVGTNTFIHELIVLAGGVNLAAGDAAYPRYNLEQVLALAPEVIVISSMARGVSYEHVRSEWLRWPDIPAVRDRRIHVVDSDLFDRPSPRLVEGLELLAKIIHPEIFGAVP